MSGSFYRNILPHVEAALSDARRARANGDLADEFKHLEIAHVLGQESTRLHTKVHWLMLTYAIRQSAPREFFGQLLRIIGAATKTVFGLVPQGNTGGANVSPFKPMPIAPEVKQLIDQARR